MKSAVPRHPPGSPTLSTMNFLERIPTGWLLTGAALACLLLWAGPGWAQTADDPVDGHALFDDAPNVAPSANLTNSCANCHINVQNRRSQIAGGPFADIPFNVAMARLGTAIGNNLGGSMSQFSRLDGQQIRDIAAYIADTPKVASNDMVENLDALPFVHTLPFVATAVGVAKTQTITLRHSVATTDNLQVMGITLSGGATAFTRTGNCSSTLGPGNSCTFSMTYTPSGTAAESKTLTIALRQGSVNFNRTITLNGSVQGVTPPPPPANTGGDDSGGGALGLAWLGGLALATAVLARRRREP